MHMDAAMAKTRSVFWHVVQHSCMVNLQGPSTQWADKNMMYLAAPFMVVFGGMPQSLIECGTKCFPHHGGFCAYNVLCMLCLKLYVFVPTSAWLHSTVS